MKKFELPKFSFSQLDDGRRRLAVNTKGGLTFWPEIQPFQEYVLEFDRYPFQEYVLEFDRYPFIVRASVIGMLKVVSGVTFISPRADQLLTEAYDAESRK